LALVGVESIEQAEGGLLVLGIERRRGHPFGNH